MKDYTYRYFKIGFQEFSVTEYLDGRIYVHSIHRGTEYAYPEELLNQPA